MKKIARILLWVCIINLSVGCIGMPTQEMSDARQAVEAARSANAELYVPKKLSTAEQNLSSAENSLELGLLDEARNNAISAKNNALQARNIAVAIDHAETIWRAIAAMEYDKQETRALLEKAKIIAQQDRIEEALALVEQSHQEGKRVLNQIFLDKAKSLIDKAKTRESTLSPDELAVLKNAESAHFMGDGEKCFSLIIMLSNNK